MKLTSMHASLIIILIIGLVYGLITAIDEVIDRTIFYITGWDKDMTITWVKMVFIYMIALFVILYLLKIEPFHVFGVPETVHNNILYIFG